MVGDNRRAVVRSAAEALRRTRKTNGSAVQRRTSRHTALASFGIAALIGSGALLAAPPAQADDAVISSVTFDDGTTGGWVPTGDPTLDYVPDDEGGLALAVVDREADYVGIETPVGLLDGFSEGDLLTFSMQVRLADGAPDSSARFVMKPDYTWIGNTAVTADAWTTVTGTFTVPAGATELVAYLGTEDTGAPYTYYVDDIVVTAPADDGNAADEPPLHETVPFPLGVAIDERETIGAASDVLRQHFTQITAENHMKPDAWYAEDHSFSPNPQVDALMDYAQANGLRVYGHVLVWHSQVPDWFFTHDDGTPLTDDPADQEILRERLRTHVFSVAEYLADGWGAFGGGNPLVAWDVVNEVVDDGTAYEDGMRRSRWYQVLGEEFVDLAFTYAEQAFNEQYADPAADRPVALFINDYNTETAGKQDRYHALVERLLGRGVPLDGVGHQFHLNLAVPVSSLEATFERFADLPVTQAVTELDVPTGSPVTQPGLVEQGYYYRDVFRTFREHADDLYSVTVWGLNDGRSWRSDQGAPLLFNDRFQAKLAFHGAADGELPATPRSALSFAGDVALDDAATGALAWQQLPPIAIGEIATFQTRWAPDHLTVHVDVDDATTEASDAVEIALGTDTVTVARDGTADVPAVVAERDGGYALVAHVPLTGAAEGDVLDLDLRVTDGGTTTGWNEEGTLGALSLVEELSYLEVAEAAQAPEIDGAVDDVWAGAGTVTTDVLTEGEIGAVAQVRTLWRDDELFVLAEVTDPVVDSTGSNPWTQDSVEIYLDAGNAKNGAYRPLDTQIRIGADGAVTFGTGDPDEQAERLRYAVTTTDVGYTVEAAITLEGTGGAGTFHGFDVQVNDASEGERTGVVNWADPTGLGYQSTARWGVAQLVEAPVVADPSVVVDPARVRILGSVQVQLTGFEPGERVTVRSVWLPGTILALPTSTVRLTADDNGEASTRIGGLSLLLPGPYQITAAVDGDVVARTGLTVTLLR